MFFSTIKNDHGFLQINGENTNKKSEQWHKWREMAFMWSERGVIRSWSCREVYFEKNGPFFTSLRKKNKISLSNRFGAFLPRFRSLNVLYKHLDGLGLLLGSPKEGQSKKKIPGPLVYNVTSYWVHALLKIVTFFDDFWHFFHRFWTVFFAFMGLLRPPAGW